MLDGNIAGLVNDLLDADWKKVEFIESIGTSLPIDLDTELIDASVYLSVQKISLEGPKRYSIGGNLSWQLELPIFGGTSFIGSLDSNISYEPENPSDPSSLGKPIFGIGTQMGIRY